MILPKRSPLLTSTHTSCHRNSELAPCFSTPELLASPPTTPPRGHKHSFSKPMTWLNRSSSSTSTHSLPHAAPKPTRIAEPKVRGSLDQFHFHRSGPLGSGATVVRTPREALFGSTNEFGQKTDEDAANQDILLHDTEKIGSRLPPLRSSPPLPPLPDITEAGDRLSDSPASMPLTDHAPPPRSSSSPSPPAHFSSSPPTLFSNSRVPSRSTLTLPVDTNLSSSQPPFDAVPLSLVPDSPIDPSKFIVTLETCTITYRILLRSLVSRPSHLSRYITSLLSPTSETASVYSNASDALLTQHSNAFSSFFRDHLASSGCLPQSTGIHVFLDRPSAPYTHVLAYLRSLPSTPEHPEMLPRAVQLGSASASRLESLLELRDEANYLGLVELEKLCCHELYRFQRGSPPTSSGCSTPPRGHSQNGSVRSFNTIVERCLSRQEVPSRTSELRVSKSNTGNRRTLKSATRESSSSSLPERNKDALIRERGKQGKVVKYGVGSPPPGWI